MSFDFETINFLDVVLVIILLLFSIQGLLRGLLQELTSFIALVGGVVLAGMYATQLSDYLAIYINNVHWSYNIAYISIIAATFISMAFVDKLLSLFVKVRYAEWFNKLGGAVTGFIKGLLIASLLVVLLQGYFYDMDFVQTSYIVPYIAEVSYVLRDFFPHIMQMLYEYRGTING